MYSFLYLFLSLESDVLYDVCVYVCVIVVLLTNDRNRQQNSNCLHCCFTLSSILWLHNLHFLHDKYYNHRNKTLCISNSPHFPSFSLRIPHFTSEHVRGTCTMRLLSFAYLSTNVLMKNWGINIDYNCWWSTYEVYCILC